VDKLVKHPYLLGGAYLLYLVAVSFLNVLYPLQIIGVFLSLMILYLVGQSDGRPNNAKAVVILLGEYSLFGYIAQIAVLQFLHLGLSHIDSEAVVLVASFVAAFALTIVSVLIVDRARFKSSAVNKLYRIVFA
jgi:hypothetical protein